MSAAQPPTSEHSILSSYLLNPSSLPQIIPYADFVKTCVPAQYRGHPHVKRLYRDLQFQRSIDVDSVRENIERECAKAGALKGRLAASIAAENNTSNGASRTKKRKRDGKDATSSTSQQNPRNIVDSDNENDNGNTTTREYKDPPSSDEETLENQVSEKVYENEAHPASASLPIKPTLTNPSTTNAAHRNHHTIATLLESMHTSTSAIEDETRDLERQCADLLREMQETISQLSDLRYGRLNRPASLNTSDVDNDNGVNGSVESFEDGIVDALTRLEATARRVIDKS